MKILGFVLFVLIFPFTALSVAFANDADPLVRNVVTHLKEDLGAMMEFGSHQRVVTTKLDEDGSPKRIEEKHSRTIWIHNKPTNEILSITCKEIDDKSRKSKRCFDVQKANVQKDSKPGKIEAEIKKVRWTELHKNFQFTVLSSDGPYSVISFRPKGSMPTKNRIEKLLSRMAGKIWVDRNFNIVKAEAALSDTVTFGWGIAAKVHQLNLQYHQRPHHNVWLPASLTVDFRAKIALVHTERQRLEAFWTGPYRKSETVWAHAVSETSTRR